MASQPIESKRTYCRVCMTQCGLIADVAGEQILKIHGDREHPITQGYTCPKGRATGRIHHHPDAITRPMMRKDGELVAVGWDEALDDVAARLRTIIDTHGPDAVGLYFGSGLGMDSSGYAMEEAFYNALGTPPKFSPLTIDGTAKVMIAGAMGQFPGLNPKTDYDNVEMLLYVGINPMVSHGHNTGMYDPGRLHPRGRRSAARSGRSTRCSPRPRSCPPVTSPPIPGKDYAILAWLVREIIDGGSARLRSSRSTASRSCAPRWRDLTAPRPQRSPASPKRELDDLLAAIRRQGRVVVETGTGITMSAGATSPMVLPGCS